MSFFDDVFDRDVMPTIIFPHSFGTDINYLPASKIISSWLFHGHQTASKSGKTSYFNLPLNAAHVEIIFQHENSPSNEFQPLCGWVVHWKFKFGLILFVISFQVWFNSIIRSKLENWRVHNRKPDGEYYALHMSHFRDFCRFTR